MSLEVQIVSIDSYQSDPPSQFEEELGLPQAPVLRVFGKLETGHTCCVHIHNVYPYLLIQWVGSDLEKLRHEIDERLRMSFGKQEFNGLDEEEHQEFPETDSLVSENPKPIPQQQTFIADVYRVKGVPFYGFHVMHSVFVKICLLNPKYIPKLSKLLTEGKIFGSKIQPFESHIPYTMQFLADYNLFPCDWLKMKQWYWRSPLIDGNLQLNQKKLNSHLKDYLNPRIINRGNELNILSSSGFQRITNSFLEADINADWILNRNQLRERDLHKRLNLQPDDAESRTEKYLSSTRGIIEDIKFQRSISNVEEKTQATLFENTKRVLKPAPWVDQEELELQFQLAIKSSVAAYSSNRPLNIETFGGDSNPKLASVPTYFSSVTEKINRPDVSKFELLPFTNDNLMEILASSQKFTKFDCLTQIEQTQDEFVDDELSNTDEPINDWFEVSLPHLTNEEELDNVGEDIQASPEESELAGEKALSQDMDSFFYSSTQNYSAINSDNRPLSSGNVEIPSTNFSDFSKNLTSKGMLKIEYPDPFYSDPSDLRDPYIFAGRKFSLLSNHLSCLEPYSETCSNLAFTKGKSIYGIVSGPEWEFDVTPKSFSYVKEWLSHERQTKSMKLITQVFGVTPNSNNQFVYPSMHKTLHQRPSVENHLISLCAECHISTRENKAPNPQTDAIKAIFWTFESQHSEIDLQIEDSGIFVWQENVNEESMRKLRLLSKQPVAVLESEIELIQEFVSLVEYIDPDIITAFEPNSSSWGYMIERCKHVYDLDLCEKFSRVQYKFNNKTKDQWGYTHGSTFKITGRHVLNLWRALTHEITLTNYTLENLVYHILHLRIPHYNYGVLSKWFESENPRYKSLVLNYFTQRVALEVQIINQIQLISKVTEEAKLIGIDFYSVLSRGSQFKVESLLVRLTKQENLLMISPSKKDVFEQDPLTYVPLIMEPEAAFYKSPIVVLDFQSLYPSLVIAYNYCYTTCLGRMQGYDALKEQTMGVTKNKLPAGVLEVLKHHITLSPNGLMFVKSNVRRSVIGKMLIDLLDTRILVKSAMKKLGNDPRILQTYNSRQLALKLIANVTYGYASATFSGRMPCADIADAIVSSARETLNRAISLIEGNTNWGARVVYGDTDSLFVYLPGKSKEDAFMIGEEMAAAVTSENPQPVKLKFEKVYHPSTLLSKKRYVGYSYERSDQTVPKFDAKGIETVRRDGIPAQQKIVEKSLRILFDSSDLSQVKQYFQAQVTKILTNNVGLQDFCFAKEVRLGTYKENYMPPGALVASRKANEDPNAVPQYRERIPYLVVKGRMKERLKDRCLSPEEYLARKDTEFLELDAQYYIEKVIIPPLERIFQLMGADVKSWYTEMPVTQRLLPYIKQPNSSKPSTIHHFITVLRCLVCGSKLPRSNKSKICQQCQNSPSELVTSLGARIHNAEKKVQNIFNLCEFCSSGHALFHRSFQNFNSVKALTASSCENQNCLLYFKRLKAETKLTQLENDELVQLKELDW
ncbi:BA75_02457T0 [Komagataella pastoris]|uniref:DNA polymerase n=1 Tax=Komagataella pastoris TaxID=4922 RepID=A0A1B2JDJ5_PICPA|nr:BA75_02457T0 [Komagataella pastoris]